MTRDEIQKLELSINRDRRELSSGSFDYIMQAPSSVNDLSDEESDAMNYLIEGLRELYVKIVCYLEARGLHLHRELFIEKLEPYLAKTKILHITGPIFSESEPSLTVLRLFNRFLSPFPVFDYFNKDSYEEKCLTETLRNTAKILQHTKVTIKNETTIYKEVRWFLEILFPTIRSLNKARFIRKFRTYHPDILIPELKTAIEYKLVREGSDIERYLNELRTDADNYDFDSEYAQFYAVLYIMDKKIATENAIYESWSEKKFDENWKLITVFH